MQDTDELIRRVLAILAEDCVPDEDAARRLYDRIFGTKGEKEDGQD